MTRLCRLYRFSASHRLHSGFLSAEQNAALYGKCNNPNGHGHNYTLEIAVEGPVEVRTGLVVSVQTLDALVTREVLHHLDRHDLNRDVPAFAQGIPTTENLAGEIRARLERGWHGAFPDGTPRLAGIRIQETKRNSVELQER